MIYEQKSRGSVSPNAYKSEFSILFLLARRRRVSFHKKAFMGLLRMSNCPSTDTTFSFLESCLMRARKYVRVSTPTYFYQEAPVEGYSSYFISRKFCNLRSITTILNDSRVVRNFWKTEQHLFNSFHNQVLRGQNAYSSKQFFNSMIRIIWN